MDGSREHDAYLEVRGGRRLEGEVVLSGAKNSALKLLAASLLTTDPCVIRRVPRITDVATMVTMLRALGASAEADGEGDVLHVHAGAGLSGCAPYELVRTMRASIIVMGPLVARLGEATIAMPGGCNIGPRRIDFHIRGLEKLGAHIDIDHGFIRVHSDGLKGAVVPLDYPSVGATENLLMAATAAEGETVIENAAREPEITDLCAFLSGMGAEIEGAGTSTIHIAGGRPLHGVDHAVICDRIEAGTYLLMGAATSGRVTTVGLEPAHLELFLAKLRAMGVQVEEGEARITVSRDGPLAPVDISTLPHPGFATDLQAQTMVLLSLAEGTSIITENVFENRFVVVDELNRLGAGIETSGHHAVIAGPRPLSGTVVEAPDLRGGAALVTAGLVADGLTEVRSVYHIDRGYEDLTGKLRGLGADVARAGESPRTELGSACVSPLMRRRGRAQRLSAPRRRSMGSYRVYKVGEDEHVREATAAAPAPLEGDGSRARRRGGARVSAPPRWWVWALVAAAGAAAVVLYWFYGRDAVSNSRAALDIAKLSGRVPDWAVVAAPVIVVAAVAAVTAYLAFGRHLAVKLIGVAVVVVVLAAPGIAVGFANGLVADVGQTGTAARTDAERQQISEADEVIDVPVADKPMNILLIGSDKSTIPGDPGRSDTQMLVRLDPETKSISMLSLPRDLRVEIPGGGYDKMNTAYSYGGPKLVIETFKSLTGLPINGWIEVNFSGFWHVVNILGGVYMPIDHKYFVPASADYKSINLEAGYQLVRGKQALNYVRYRHDQKGDFTRMQRQQLFLKEVQRQSGRWSSDVKKVLKLIKAITGETKSSLSSLKKIEPLVGLAFEVDTSKVYQAHLEGETPMIDGVSYVTATESEIADVVDQFTNPTQAPVSTKGTRIGKKAFPVLVYNGSGIDGLATSAASQLSAQGYKAEAVADAYEYPGETTGVYAPKDLEAQADVIGQMLAPADVHIVARAPGSYDGVTVFIASSFNGLIDVPQEVVQEQQTLEKDQKVDWATWQEYDKETPLRLEAPTAWASGSTYDEWRDYSIETTDGKHSAASVAVVKTPQYGYWSIQAMRWQDPPAIENPSGTHTIGGRKFMLFYQGDHLHMVAWKEHGTLYWVLNTLDNQLSNDLMLGLAASCKPVK